MPSVNVYGYLGDAYLQGPYLTGHVTHGVFSQVERVISGNHVVNSQATITVQDLHAVNSQIDRLVIGIHDVRSQVERIIDDTHSVLSQIALNVGDTHIVGSEIRRGNVLFIECGGYLQGPYLAGPYLVQLDMFCAQMRSQIERLINVSRSVMSQVERRIDTLHSINEQVERRIDAVHSIAEQVERRIDDTHTVNEQVERRIDAVHSIAEQVERRIDAIKNIGSQIERLRAQLIHEQITRVLYNITNLRILCDFANRGTTGLNWSANSTEAGDFSVNNLNTDIVEQVWRSSTGVKTGIILVCDTEVAQGVFVDTLAILNHNMTTSAAITWQVSNDAGFASIGFSEVIVSTTTNIFWIAPSLPATSYRYHRFLIDDGTNSADYLQWGTVLFGSSSIFQGDNIVDRVIRRTTHFSDKIETEGFTNVSNDRALKYSTSVEFRNLDYRKGNYQRLRDVFEDARTSLKCLWIPTPTFPSRFAVFGKLTEMPSETHNVKGENLDYVDIELTIDESL